MLPADVRLHGVDGAQLHILERTRLSISTTSIDHAVTIDAYILPKLETGVGLLIGDPGIRAMVKNQPLREEYSEGKAEAFVGALNADLEEVHVIEDTDCIVQQFKRNDKFD